MHYMGYVFVAEPTDEVVKEAMEYHKGKEWDWYRCGGRWDGHFHGADEMKSRETHQGFNFDDKNDDASRNCKAVKDLDPEKPPYFFVADYHWIPKEYYNEYHKNDSGKYYGAILETPHFFERWADALEKYSDAYVVVVDAHN